MKLVIVVALLLCTSSVSGQSAHLVELLDSLVKVDQDCRTRWAKKMNNELKDDIASLESLSRQCLIVDSLNYPVLRDIFIQHGFPNYDIAGVEGSKNFWLLVQHQDNHPSFQDSVLTSMKAEVDAGKASMSHYAYLVDRVKVNFNLPQVYGTQMEWNEQKKSFLPKAVFDPEQLNERRIKAGLDSIEDYIELMNKRYPNHKK